VRGIYTRAHTDRGRSYAVRKRVWQIGVVVLPDFSYVLMGT
jgi:hypothetical protein